jgi:hypothetical protein
LPDWTDKDIRRYWELRRSQAVTAWWGDQPSDFEA